MKGSWPECLGFAMLNCLLFKSIYHLSLFYFYVIIYRLLLLVYLCNKHLIMYISLCVCECVLPVYVICCLFSTGALPVAGPFSLVIGRVRSG